MKLKYELSKLGLKDISSIWNFTAKRWSVNQANKYYKQLLKEIDKICKNPKIGKSIAEVKENHRSRSFKSHLVISKIDEEKIFIDRILHQKMDIDNELIE
jgi:toxin ParE1/3/4